jgi:hypothetical protein
VRLVNRDGVAVLADDAGTHFVQRVAPLAAAGGKVFELAVDHGRGLSAHGSTLWLAAHSQNIAQKEGAYDGSFQGKHVPSHSPHPLTMLYVEYTK